MENKDHKMCNTCSLISGKTIRESVLVNQSWALAIYCVVGLGHFCVLKVRLSRPSL